MNFLAVLIAHFNIRAQCRNLGVPLWSCPPFLFLLMGVINIVAILATYYVAQQYAAPELVILIVIGLSIFLFVVSFTIVHAFEQVVLARAKEAMKHRELLQIKDQFVFIAAHELRTPANAIQWTLENLERKEPEFFKKRAELLSILTASSMKLLDLVKDLLEVSRIETGSLSLHLVPVSFFDAVELSLKGLSPFLRESGITVLNHIPPTLPSVRGDAERLKEVVDNLITNAIKYNRKNGTITLAAEEKKDGIFLQVTDQGNGILPEDQPHVFEKFWRSVGMHAIEGTGLGLFIVRKLIELMHGRVSFSTKVGVGSTFSIFLPYAAER